jgi:hypothetical protein
MCNLNVRFTVACVFDVNFEFSNLKMTLKTHATVKRTSKLHIQNAGVIDHLGVVLPRESFLAIPGKAGMKMQFPGNSRDPRN